MLTLQVLMLNSAAATSVQSGSQEWWDRDAALVKQISSKIQDDKVYFEL